MALRLCTGFEFGTTAGWATGNTGSRIVDTVAGTPTIATSAPVRTGTYALEISTAAAAENVQWTSGGALGASQTRGRSVFAIRFPSALPAATVTLARWNPATGSLDSMNLQFNSTDNTLRISVGSGGTPSIGPVVVADTWYVVELYSDVSAATHTLDWWVDGVAQSQASKATAASTLADFLLGTPSAHTYTARYDDLAVWTDTAAIAGPVGTHKVLLLTPDTGGATAQIGTANATARMVTNSAIDATHNSANILAATSEVPPLLGATASGLGQRTAGAGNACGLPMTTYTLQTGESVTGMRVLVCGWAGSASAASIGLRAFNGSAETILFAAADPNFDNSITTPAWLCKMYAGVTDQTTLDALVVRIGYSGDIAPLPGVHAVYGELAVKEAAGTTPVGATDFDTSWRVLAQVTSDLVTSWRVAAQVTSDLLTNWRVYAPVGTSDLVTSWRVLSSLTPVASDLVTSWRVSARIAADLTTSWRVYTSATSDLATSWRVFTPIAATDLATSWRVLHLVTPVSPSDLVTSWKVSALVGPSDLATSWKVLIPPYEPILVGLDHATTAVTHDSHSHAGTLEAASTGGTDIGATLTAPTTDGATTSSGHLG